MSSPSSSSMSTADRQKAIQAILRDSSLSESEKRKQILDLNKPTSTASNEQATTAPSAAAAAAAKSSPDDSDDDDDDDDMALAKARARKPAAAAAAAAATTLPPPSSNLPQDAALAKARAQNHMGRATAPGVQAIGATGNAYAAAASHDDDDDDEDDVEKDSKQQSSQEDPALAKARAFGGGAAAQASTAVGARAMSNNNADDPALAKMRAFGGGGGNVARGSAAAAKGSSKHDGDDDDDDEEEEDDIQDEDAALAKARGRKPSSPEIKTAPGANAVASNEYDATIAKARGESASAQGSAVVEDHKDFAATALEKKLETNGITMDVVHQPLLSQYQKEDALKDAISDDNMKKSASGIGTDGGGSGRRLRKGGGGGIIAHEDDDDGIIDIVDKDEKKSLMHDSYYGDGYDAPIEATARPGYGVGSYLIQEQNASAAPQGNGDAVHVVHQDMGGTSDDVYADTTTTNLYGGVGAVLADDGAPPATTADASPALAAEAVTYAMDVKEIIPEAEVQKKEKRNIYRKWLVIAILTVCLVVPATVTAVVLGMSKQRRNNEAVGNGSTADEPPSTMAPTSSNHQMYQTRLIELGISSQEAMSNPLSAQNQALRWMTSVDGLALSLEEGIEEEEEQLLFIQRYTMATLYYSTNGDSWAQCNKDDVQTHCMDGRKNVWLSDTSECDWAGVGCNGNGMVAMISILYPLNMNGPLPQEMASLQSLNDLSIVTQQISGPLPTWIGKLTNLLTVRLYENRMIGTLPSSLFTLPYLRNLVLRNNEFTGTINTAIGNMTSLISLHLSNNLLSGPIPDSISNLSNLKELYLYGNELNGPLPSSLYNMSNVEEIVLAYNFLTDELSPSVSKWDSLKKLNLRNNQFNGDIPKELGFLLKLEQLDLVENNFVGEMPKELCYLRDFKLQILAADCSGSTPEIMCTCCTSCERRRQLQQLRSGFLR